MLAIITIIFILIGIFPAGADEKTPETAFIGICKFFGEPDGDVSRNSLVDSLGEGTAEDQLWVLDFVGRFIFILNRSDKPYQMVSWVYEPALEKDYKTMFKLLHTYGEGYGISEYDRCVYLIMEVGSDGIIPFATSKNVEPDGKYSFESVDKMIEAVIRGKYPNLITWMKKELFSTSP